MAPASLRPLRVGLVASLIVLGAPRAEAQTGVSDDRVSLPEGPGSIGGLGDGALLDRNHGSFRYSYPLELPEGQRGLRPELSLDYDSGAGASVVGIGWRFDVPSVERSTLRGLPRYSADDEVVADRAEELIRVSSGASGAVYRARFERGFVRWTWHDAGREGYWTAEYPDGRVGWFGADKTGTIVPSARLGGTSGTFRWNLVDLVDPYGHAVHWSWSAHGGTILPARIEWGASASGAPLFRVELSYAPRTDLVSDARPGFEEVLADRLARIDVSARGTRLRSWVLGYETEATSGGLSRLATIEQLGADGARYPVVISLQYSRSLTGVCPSGNCEGPFVVDMGTLPGGLGVTTGATQLVDLDGDALPDVVDASQNGAFRIFRNRLDGPGRARFDATVVSSAVGTKIAFPIGDPRVQVLDLNGDGLADLLNAATGRVLCNTGRGDFAESGCDAGSGLSTGLEAAPDDAALDPLRTRFLDLDGDHKIDVLKTAGGNTLAWVHSPSGFDTLTPEALGRELDTDHLDLADLNGDGLLDPVLIETDGTVRFRINLGFAQWSDWTTASAPRVDPSDVALVDFQDLNGDGLADMVAVGSSRIRYALNESGGRFSDFVTVDPTKVTGSIPERGATTTVLFADMNGTGSDDIVWIEPNGHVRYLELFPVRPNLLVRIENGIGWVQTVNYGTAAEHRSVAATPWTTTLPMAVNIVDALDTYVTLTGREDGTGIHEVDHLEYTDGWYDGRERRFRGFAHVEERSVADDGDEPGLTIYEYDLGQDDPHRAGLLLRRATFADTTPPRPLEEQRHVFMDCPLDGVPTMGLVRPVRFVCERETTRILQEGAPVADWRTLRTERTFDGFGNVLVARNLGVVNLGAPESPAACGPCDAPDGTSSGACGPTCTGDEEVVETTYVAPLTGTNGRWILGRAHTIERGNGAPGEAATENLYYDGPDYLGLALGQLDRGTVTRRTAEVEAGRSIEQERVKLDEHGNAIVILGALADASKADDHRRLITFDADGLHPVHVELPLSAGYRLVRDYRWDSLFDRPIDVKAWAIAGEADGPSTKWAYDAFGRLVKTAEPGDTLDAPTAEMTWELASPVSRVVVRRRATSGGPADLEEIRCLDGLGRLYETRTKVASGEYLVSAHVAFDRQGRPVREYLPRTERDGACADREPSDTPFTRTIYDAAGRPIRRVLPDGDLFGGRATELVTAYAPLVTTTWDGEDSDPSSPNRDTPESTTFDGLERVVAFSRVQSANAVPSTTRVLWDSRGHQAGLVSPTGAVKLETRDHLGRLVSVDDPATGRTTWVLDDDGRPLETADARGIVTKSTYDGLGRLIATWDDGDRASTEVRQSWDRSGACAAEKCTFVAGRLAGRSWTLPTAIATLAGGPAEAEEELGYDARGRVVHEARIVAGVRFETARVVDGVGREITTRYPDGASQLRAFDLASRVTRVEGLVDQVTYDPRGEVSGLVHADGSGDDFAYDVRLEIARHTTYTGDGQSIADRTYGRDRNGQVRSVMDDRAKSPGVPEESLAVELDAWRRVTSAKFAGSAPETLAFAYDAIDALASATSDLGSKSAAHVGDYRYQRPGVASQAGELALDHDAAGHLAKRGEATFTWDFLGRLTRVDGSAARTFAYGLDRAVVARAIDGGLDLVVSEDYEVEDGVGVRYERAGGAIVGRVEAPELAAHVLSDLAPATEQGGMFVPAPDAVIDAGDAWLANAAARGVITLSSTGREPSAASVLLRSSARRMLAEARGTTTHLHADHRGSLVFATRDGEVVGARSYHPYGAVRAERGFVDERGFEGMWTDRALNLASYPNRWLDVARGQWASADPAFVELDLERADESTNLFAYVSGSPIDRVDPTGLASNRQTGNGSKATGKPAKVSTSLKVKGLALRAARVFSGSAARAAEGVPAPASNQPNAQGGLRNDGKPGNATAARLGSKSADKGRVTKAAAAFRAKANALVAGVFKAASKPVEQPAPNAQEGNAQGSGTADALDLAPVMAEPDPSPLLRGAD